MALEDLAVATARRLHAFKQLQREWVVKQNGQFLLIVQAAATEHASEEMFGMLPSTDALTLAEGGEGGEGGECGEGGEGGEGGGGAGGNVKGSERGAGAASEAGSEASKGRRRRKKSVWGDALQQTAQSKPTALGDMWSVTGGVVVGAVVKGAVVGVDGVRGAGDKAVGAVNDLHVNTVVKANVDNLSRDLQSDDSSARHHALELLDAVSPLPARTQLIEAINARIRLSCLLMPPDGVPEFYSPTALHARSMLLQARFLQDAAEIERLSRLIASFSGLQPISDNAEFEEEVEDKNLSTWHTKE